jgi:hypothetical protein
MPTADIPPAQPHDPPVELVSDAFFVQSSIQMARGMRINRNMVVLREDGELALLNPVRLTAEGERELEALGEVKHLLRLGMFHGVDDAYLKGRYGATFWCQAGSNVHPEPKPDRILEEGAELPFRDMSLFVYHQTKQPECAVIWNRDGGLLVTCDSIQHHVSTPRCSLMAKAAMHAMGFMKPANIGPPWRKSMTKKGGSLQPDFERLLKLDFDHLVGAHGTQLLGGAKPVLATTVKRVFG